MIARIIQWSINQRILIVISAIILSLWGVYAIKNIPLDAIPDLSDVQVIVKTSYPGQAPQVVEDQVTYPLSTAMLAVPGAKSVRGYSFFGDSYIYIIFDDNTDIYWARSRVLEYLSQLADQLPENVQPKLGPDASGVGWVYQYALIDRSGQHDLSELRSLQDWNLKYELQSLPGVAEVASLGGMVKQYQVIVDPNRLRGYYLTLENVKRAVSDSNRETSASTIEIAEAEYLVRIKGYLKSVKELKLVSVPTIRRRTSLSSVLLEDVAEEIKIGPAARRGVADLNGEGEVVGGVIVMRHGENALTTIKAVKAKLEALKPSLPKGIEIVETYDRSKLIKESVATLSSRLIEESIVVLLICTVFLAHFRSSLALVIFLPVSVLAAFLIMHLQGISANIMSLGGIAIAIGALVDAAIVMLENVHKRLENSHQNEIDSDQTLNRLKTIYLACVEVGKPLFISLLIITVSFVPIFALQGQEARMFLPLAFTKTYAMAASSILSISLLPALIVFFVKGNIKGRDEGKLSQWIKSKYKPLIEKSLHNKRRLLFILLALMATLVVPLSQLGTQFMPELEEGDILYMPTTLPAVSIDKARQILQQTDSLIKQIPEVKTVFGKVGRADTATDPAPLTMLETTIQLQSRDQWRAGMTFEKLKQELDRIVHIPGMNNAWLMPIKTRIEMQSTGINTPIGIKIVGTELSIIQSLGEKIEAKLRSLPETGSVYADRASGARYIEIEIDRDAAAHFGLSIGEIESAASAAIGGVNLTTTIENRERYQVNIRYPERMRNSIEDLKSLQIIATEDTHIQLQDLAEIKIKDGPPMIKSENGRLNGWVYLSPNGIDIESYVKQAKLALKDIKLPQGYQLQWTGSFKKLESAKQRFWLIIPVTLLLIFVLLYFCFDRAAEVLLVLSSLPLAVIGGVWLTWLLDIDISVAVAVGFIALAGVAAEFGVVMLIYLRQAIETTMPRDVESLRIAVIDGALLRVRPKVMTALVIILGLLPILIGSGAGSTMMKSIATPMLGGMITAPLVSMIFVPVAYFSYLRNRLLNGKSLLAREQVMLGLS